MSQVNAVPDRAATIVVHPTPGIGDATTIAGALALVQQLGGGDIFVREGTYAISSTIILPAGIPIAIRGTGNGTIIDLGGNAIPAFTVPTGALTNTPIIFDAFKVTGNETAGQAFLKYDDTNSLAEIYIENLVTVGVEITINITSSSQGGATPGVDDARFHMFRCRIRPCATNNSVMLTNSSFGLPRCWMKEVEFIGDSLFAIPGGRTAPLFGRIADNTYFGDLYLDSCEMSVGTGEEDYATFETIDSTVWNNDNVNTTVIFALNGSFAGLFAGTIRDSSFRGIHFQAFENNNFISNWLQDTSLELYGAGTVVGDNQFIQVGTYGATFIIQINNNNMVIRHNRFKVSSPPSFVVDIEAPTRVIGNDFSEVHPPAANGTLFIDNGDCIVVGNIFTFAPTTGPNVKEINGPTMYDDNVQLFTNKTGGGPIIDPIIPRGNGSTVEDVLDFNGSGSIGAGTIQIVWYRNPYGLAKFQGYVNNTETYITQDEGTFTRTTTPVTPGTKIILDPYNFAGLGAIDNQVIDYRVSLTTLGGAIAWHVYFAAPGGVTGT
jgi:hypothetical protein